LSVVWFRTVIRVVNPLTRKRLLSPRPRRPDPMMRILGRDVCILLEK